MNKTLELIYEMISCLCWIVKLIVIFTRCDCWIVPWQPIASSRVFCGAAITWSKFLLLYCLVLIAMLLFLFKKKFIIVMN